MKKITLPDFERNQVKKTSRWLGWLSLCLMFFLGSFTMIYGQGNTCNAPLVVSSLPYSLSGDTSSYGDDYETANLPPVAPNAVTTGTSYTYYIGGDDVVFSITPSINGSMNVSASNLGTWSGVYVITGCPFSSIVGYNVSTGEGTKEIMSLPVVANTTYYIIISTWPSPQSTPFTLNVTGTPGLLTPPEACTGIPSAGTAAISPAGGNAGSTFTASATGVTSASGLTYQWQKLVGSTWEDIAGATTVFSQIVAGSGAVGTIVDYRLAVTCTSSAEVSYSSVASYTIQLVYCPSVPTSNDNSGITNITLGTSSFPVADVTYYDHPTTVNLIAGITNQALITFATGYTYGTNIWIDLNDNGTFEASELLFQGESTNVNPTIFDASFLIDAGASLGMHKMRIGTADVLQTPPNPCYSGSYGITVDVMVNIFAPPACLPPSALTALNITSSTADLSWTSNGTLFDIEWGTQGFTLGSGTSVNDVSFPYTLTLPSPNSSYSYYVRQDCGTTDGVSFWSGPFTFKTACAPVSEFTENFDSYTATGATNPLPSCWTRLGNTGSSYITTGSNNPLTAPNRLYLSGSATTGTNGIAVMPQVSNLQAETHRLKFKGYCTTAGKSLEIGYFELPDDASSFIVLEVFEMPSTALATATEFVYTPEFVPTGVQSIAFKVNGGAFTGTTTMYIDDVVWEEIPSCGDITEIELSNITSTSLDILWIAADSETAWQYVYAESTVTDPSTLTPMAVNNNPYLSLSDLTPNTSYNLWIRSNCGPGSLGNWSSVQNFTTACTPVTSFTENFDSYTATGSLNPLPDCWTRAGNGNTYITTGGALPGTPPNRLYMNASGTLTTPTESIAIMPAVSNLSDGTHRLKFRAYASAANKTIEIGYFGDASDLTTYIPLQVIDLLTTTAATAAVYTYIPVGVPSGITTFAFKNTGLPASTTVYIDDVVWEAQPLCPDVNTVIFDGATSSTASISWNAGGSETAWEYVYGLATVTDPTTLTPFPVSGTPATVINGLLPSTTYKVWVRSTCGTNLGAFSSALTFVTACEAITTLPWTEGFEGVTTVGTNAYPPCWFEQNGDWTTAIAGTRNTPHTGLNYLRNSYSAVDEYMWTPGFELTAGMSYDFSFYMQGDGYPDWSIALFHNTQQLGTGATQIGNSFTPVITGAIGTIQDYQQILNTFVPSTTGVYYFAIRVNVNGSPWYVAFDDFKLELSPNCVQPTVEPASVVTSSSATINWSGPFTPPANGYEYFVTSDLALVPTMATVATGSVAAGVMTATVNDLTSSTPYKYYVRSICSANESSSWSSAGTFTTPCVAVSTFPWNEGFEGITTVGTTAFPPCWFKENGDWSSAIASNYNTPNTGTKYIRVNWTAVNEYMWTPGFAMTAGTSYDFSFFMQGDGNTGWDVDVFHNTIQSSTNATQIGNTVTATGSGSTSMQTYQLVNNTFTPTADGIYYFAVRVNQPSGGPWYVAFDDFKLELSPNCVTPTTDLANNVTTTTATINWVAPFNAPANGYDYYITTTTDAPTAATVPTGNVAAGITTKDLVDLSSSTMYRFYVRGVCGATETSAWSQAGTFTTLCDAAALPYTINFESVTVPNMPLCTSNQNVGTGNNWVTANNPGSGFTSKTLRYSYSFSDAANAWFYTNRVNLVAGTEYSVSYRYGTNSTATYVENLKVSYGIDATNTSMTTVIADHPGIVGTTPQINTASFTPAVSGMYVIGFNVYSAANQNSLFLDDIVIQEALGTVDFNSNTFTAYPNPVKNNLTIRYNETITDASVYNLLGQQLFVKAINATEGQIDMSHLASGTYLVKVNSGDRVETIKVIKE